MTTSTETYIELSDIVGVRLQCKSCGCSLHLEIEKDNGTINNLLAANNLLLTKCPTCGASWTPMGQPGQWLDSEAKEFFRKMRDLKKIEASYGCKLALEIKGLAASGRALNQSG
jgi:hypothetical protein